MQDGLEKRILHMCFVFLNGERKIPALEREVWFEEDEWSWVNKTFESEPLADLAVNIENDYNRNRSGRPQLK